MFAFQSMGAWEPGNEASLQLAEITPADLHWLWTHCHA